MFQKVSKRHHFCTKLFFKTCCCSDFQINYFDVINCSDFICREEILKTLKFIPNDRLIKETIPAGGLLKVPVHVLQLNSLLQWYFTVSAGDIDFKITYDEEKEEV